MEFHYTTEKGGGRVGRASDQNWIDKGEGLEFSTLGVVND